MSSFPHTTRNLLRRFLSGEVGPMEEAELNRRAKTDEALAEALAGYREFPEENHEARLRRLRKKTPQRIVRPLRQKLSIAAGIFLIIAASLYVFNRSEPLQQTESAATEAGPLASSEAPEEEVSAAKEVPTPQAEPRPFETEAAKPTPAGKKAASPEAGNGEPMGLAGEQPDSQEESFSDEVATNSPKLDSGMSPGWEAADLAPEATNKVAREKAAIAPISEPAMEAPAMPQARTFSRPASARVIRGYVTDDQDRPIVEANITLPGQPIGEYTDSSGYFALVTDRSVSSFEVNHPLFEGTEVALPRGESEVQISLSSLDDDEASAEDWFFDGARTTIYPNREKSSAGPVGGLQQLRSSMRADKPANLPQGKVKVSFSVQSDGSLTDLEFDKQSEAPLIEYVRNYLEQRSSWEFEGDERNPVRMVLTFRFD